MHFSDDPWSNDTTDSYTAVRSQKAVSAYFTSEQMLTFGFI